MRKKTTRRFVGGNALNEKATAKVPHLFSGDASNETPQTKVRIY
jgi:hypothetical protein